MQQRKAQCIGRRTMVTLGRVFIQSFPVLRMPWQLLATKPLLLRLLEFTEAYNPQLGFANFLELFQVDFFLSRTTPTPSTPAQQLSLRSRSPRAQRSKCLICSVEKSQRSWMRTCRLEFTKRSGTPKGWRAACICIGCARGALWRRRSFCSCVERRSSECSSTGLHHLEYKTT